MDYRLIGSQAVTNFVMALFTVVIAGIEFQQCRDNRDSDRPWLGAVSRKVFVDTIGTVGSVRWEFVNGGKSPAKDVRLDLALVTGQVVPKDEKEVKAPEVPKCTGLTPLPGNTGPVALPGVRNAIEVFSPQTVVDSSESINTNKVGLYLVGCVDYRGVSGGNYRTEVCEFYVVSSGEFHTCPTGNNAR